MKLARIKTSLPAGIALVVDKNRKLLGIATDGDIRRSLSTGISLTSPISKAMNTKPFVIVGPHSSTEILSLVVEKIRKEHWHKDRLNKIILVDQGGRVEDVVGFYDLWHQSDVRFRSIGVIGLGYVGLTLALILADLGFKVRGFDKSRDVRNALKRGRPHFFEAGLPELLKDHLGKNFRIADNFKGENNCDIYFIAVGTPLTKDLKPDLTYIQTVAENLAKVLKGGDAVILRSTVPIGTTRNIVVPILEKGSGLKAGEGFFVAFAPERTAEGQALEELRKLPQVIGGLNRASSDLAASIFGFLTNTVHLVDSLEGAEMVKLINNTYRDVVFAYANEIALICQKWGIDTHKVINAANAGYERSNVPKPSPGVGGYCLEKDPFIFLESARAKNYEPRLFHRAREISNMMVDFVANSVIGFLKEKKRGVKNPKIFILGFAFKGRPITSDMRGSTTLNLVAKLRQENYGNIYGYDPIVRPADIRLHNVKSVADLEKGFEGADAVVVMNNNPAFEALSPRKFLRLSARPVLFFDSWALYNKAEVAKAKGVEYRRL